MAEAKKNAQQPAEAPKEAAAKPKKPVVLYIVIVLLLLVIVVGGIFAAWLFFTLSSNQNFGEPTVTAEQSGGAADHKEKEKEKKSSSKSHDSGEPPVFEKLDVYTANLQGGQILQAEIHVQVADEKVKEQVKNYLPRISSQINLILSSKKSEEVASVEGKIKLMEEIKQACNKVLDVRDERDGVMSVEFKTFIVQ